MNVSTKSEYGLRALIYLAEQGGLAGQGGPAGQGGREAVPAREIAERWSVPVKYLEQILKTLKEGGVVTAQVGLGGGYRLARPATLITAGSVIRLLDGRIAPMGCVSASDYEPCEFEPGCGLRTLWARARAALLGVLDETTVADLCSPAEGQRAVGLKTVPKR